MTTAQQPLKNEPECRFNCECHLPNHSSCNINGGCDCPSLRDAGCLNDASPGGKRTQVRNHLVSIWGSHPDEENDDCWTGEHFRTLAEAEVAFKALMDGGVPEGWALRFANDFAFVELDSTELPKPRYYENKGYKKARAREDRLDRQEAQMQTAMAFGIQGYNDYEGC